MNSLEPPPSVSLICPGKSRIFAIIVGSIACAGFDHSIAIGTGDQKRATLSITASSSVADEGAPAIVQIARSGEDRSLIVRLSVSGDASFEGDFLLENTDSFDGTEATVTFPAEKSSIELVLTALEDIFAEADEAISLTVLPGADYEVDATRSNVTITIPQNDYIVTNIHDSGEGSLRQAVHNANEHPGLDTITFDSTMGPFATPQTILLNRELPPLVDEIEINGRVPGRLWKPVGVTVSGQRRSRVFTALAGANVTIEAITIAYGSAKVGAGILNRGMLVIKDTTLVGNVAAEFGGGLANLGPSITIINTTFANNRAGLGGGGLAHVTGTATVTNCTFSENAAGDGGGLFSKSHLLLRNTILAKSASGGDCVNTAAMDAASTNNLIELNNGCGKPISTADPELEPLNGYNGPTHTFALRAGSPAVNLGDNDSAVDEKGQPLVWDQRGGGDPRFVAGFTDIGAFEHQAFSVLMVDSVGDSELRSCTHAGKIDCSLRGAINLANATQKAKTILFDPRVFATPQRIVLTRPLPALVTEIVLDASATAGVMIVGDAHVTVESPQLKLVNITVDGRK